MRLAIEVSNLRKVYGGRAVVDGVSFEVGEGEVFGVLGPNGAGKTTTVECITGLRRPDSGSIRVLGHSAASDSDTTKRSIGVQLQQSALPDAMHVNEAISLFAAAYGRRDNASALLAEWGLTEKQRMAFGSLSGGERQRLFIVLALLGQPDIVILDELTTGLDPAARRDAWTLLRRLREAGTTVVLVTHAMDEAETLCDRVVVMVAGRVAKIGRPEELTAGHDSLVSAYLSLTGRAPMEVAI